MQRVNKSYESAAIRKQTLAVPNFVVWRWDECFYWVWFELHVGLAVMMARVVVVYLASFSLCFFLSIGLAFMLFSVVVVRLCLFACSVHVGLVLSLFCCFVCSVPPPVPLWSVSR